MKLTELILDELESEGERSRRALELVPEGKHDWNRTSGRWSSDTWPPW